MSEPTSLYRHFDAAGQLLYVGISLSAIHRLASHGNKSHWADEISRVEIERFLTKEDALAAESLAIALEAPLYNVQHNGESKVRHVKISEETRARITDIRRASTPIPSVVKVVADLVEREWQQIKAHESKAEAA